MHARLLDVVTTYANPIRWKSRLKVHRDFEQRMLDAGVRLTTVECAYGERSFDLEDHPHINRVRVRAKTLVWNKECLLNIGISRLDHDWKYVGWIDADIAFRNASWASEAVHALQIYDIIQPWSDAYDLGPNGEHLAVHRSFCRQFWDGQPVVPTRAKMWAYEYPGGPLYPHSGYAWCATRQAVEWLGGLIDTGAVGAGDHHMALALVGEVGKSVPMGVSTGYLRPLWLWQDRALHHINRNIGFIYGTIEHFWHGRKTDRRYVDRWKIITDHKFDPFTDLKRNTHGVLELSGSKPQFARALDHYFKQRNEDANTID